VKDIFDGFSFGPSVGIDAALEDTEKTKSIGPVKIGNAQVLNKLGFQRVSGTNYLINVTEEDLWKIEADGTIVRCFEEDEVYKGS